VSVVAKRHGISEQTIYTWRKRFGGFQASDVRRPKRLELENARLKKLVAERDLEIEVMKEAGIRSRPSAQARRRGPSTEKPAFLGGFRLPHYGTNFVLGCYEFLQIGGVFS